MEQGCCPPRLQGPQLSNLHGQSQWSEQVQPCEGGRGSHTRGQPRLGWVRALLPCSGTSAKPLGSQTLGVPTRKMRQPASEGDCEDTPGGTGPGTRRLQ